MSIRVVHIGLGKSASTLLSKEIFPRIANYKGVDFISNYKAIKLKKQFIVSNINIVTPDWQFYKLEETFEYNKKLFDRNCHILITIRKPSEFLNSVYVQKIHELVLIREEDFFINKRPAELTEKDKIKYNLYNFDYDYLINMYKSYFDKVTVSKHENINDLNFLDKLFNLEASFKQELIYLIKNQNRNRGFSRLGVNICFFLNKFFDLKKFNYRVKKLKTKNDTYFSKFINKLLNQLIIRSVIQNKLDKYNPFYKKYRIKTGSLPIDLKKLDRLYDEIET